MYIALIEITSWMWSEPQNYNFSGESANDIFDKICDETSYSCIVRMEELTSDQMKHISKIFGKRYKGELTLDDIESLEIETNRGTIKCKQLIYISKTFQKIE